MYVLKLVGWVRNGTCLRRLLLYWGTKVTAPPKRAASGTLAERRVR
jgi:hypothetical protein